MTAGPTFSLNFVKLPVRDVAAQVEFYRRGLGLQERNRMEGDGFVEVFLGAADEPQMLLLVGYADGRISANATIGYKTSDIEAARQQLIGAGATAEGPILDFPAVRACFVRDPEGNQLELIEFAAA